MPALAKPSLNRILPIVSVAMLALASTLADAGPYSSLVVFGDSLSDDGNNAAAGLYDPTQVITGNTYIPTSAYAAGTYSNGPVWATDFASMIGVPLLPSLAGGTDFAFGGARVATPGPGPGGFPYDLLVQAGAYLGATGNVASASALYVVAGGGNDARDALETINSSNFASVIATAAAAFATHINTIVDELKTAGAQHIVVWDVPNLGLAPAVVASGGASTATFLAASMNSALAASLAGKTGVSTFDIFGLGTAISASPSFYGLTNTTDACGAIAGANCNLYAYWDGIHPTAATHALIADAVFAVAVPEPETWGLIVAGLAFVGWKSKARRAALAQRSQGGARLASMA